MILPELDVLRGSGSDADSEQNVEMQNGKRTLQ